MSELDPKVAETTRVALEISSLLYQASEAQWQRSSIAAPTDEDDSGIRSKGQISDPTADTTGDPVRLSLREAVIHAKQLLHFYQTGMAGAARNLQDALDRWNGGV